MNIVSEPAYSSLAQRITRVRNCMLVEVSTDISATDKDLFPSLCQTYEQQCVVTSGLPGEASESFPYWILSTSNSMQEATQPTWSISPLGRSAPLWQRGIGFLVTNCADFGGSNDDTDDPDDTEPTSKPLIS